MARIGSRVKRIHPKAVEMLKEQSWPGNVRQLHHEIQRAMIFEESPELKVSSFGQSPEDPEVSRSEEHTSELQSLMRISYAVFCLKKKKKRYTQKQYHSNHHNAHNYKTYISHHK